MSDLPLHPAIVHLPLGIAMVLPLIAVAVLLGWREALLPKRTWWIVVGLQALLFVSAFASMQLGESDAEIVDGVVPHAAIETHEDRAKAFTITAGVLLLLGIVAGASIDRRGQLLAGITVVGMVADAGLGVYAGEAGGDLVFKHDAAGALKAKSAKGGKNGKSAGASKAGDAAAPAKPKSGAGKEAAKDKAKAKPKAKPKK